MAMEGDAPRRAGWYYGWNIVSVLMVVLIAAIGMAISSFSLFLHAWSSDLKASVSTLQLVMTPLSLVSGISGSIIGGMADRYPSRWLIGGGVLGMALFNLAVSLVTRTWELVLLYALLLPIVLNLTTLIVANPLVSRWFVRRLGLALGLTTLGVGFAGVIVPPLVAAVLPLVGWRGVWRVSAAVLALAVAPLVFLVLRERPTQREGLAYVSVAAGGDDDHQRPRLGWRAIIGRKNFWLVGGMFLPIISVYQGILYNLAPIAESRSLGPQAAGMLLAVLSLVQMAATPVLGILSDRFGNRPLFLALIIAAAAGSALFTFGNLPVLVAAAALIGIAGGVWTLLGASIAVEFGAANAGQAFGLMLAIAPLGGLASFVVARLKEGTGSYVAGILILTATLGVAVAACLMMREKRGVLSTADERQATMEEAVPRPVA